MSVKKITMYVTEHLCDVQGVRSGLVAFSHDEALLILRKWIEREGAPDEYVVHKVECAHCKDTLGVWEVE